MPASAELSVAVQLAGAGQLKSLLGQLRSITAEARRANQAMARLGTGPGRRRPGRRGTAGVFQPTKKGAQAFRQTFQQLDGTVQSVSKSMENVGRTAQGAFRNVASGAQQASNRMQRLHRFSKLTQSVLEAYLLYRGFVFLSDQAQQLVKTLSELEHQVALVQTQLGGVAETDFTGTIEREVRDVASQTGAELDALAETQFDIISANVKLQDSFSALDSVAKAAVAGGVGDMRTVWNAAITQVNAFNRDIEDTNEILDKQFNALRRGIFTYEQFVNVSGRVSAAFANIGQDVATANAALATISQIFTGPQLERGATGLKNMATAIGENSEAFEELGVEVFDAQGNFRNFLGIMQDLDQLLQGMTEKERFEVLQDLFPNKRELRGALAIVGEMDKFEQFLVEQRFAAGSVDDAFQTMNDTLKNQANILQTDLLPAGQSFLRTITSLVKGVNNLNDAMPGFTSGLLTLGMAAGVSGGARAFMPSVFASRAGRTATSRIARERARAAATTMGRPDMARRQLRFGMAGRTAGATSAFTPRMPRFGVGGAALLGMGGLMSFQSGQAPGQAGAGQVIGNILAGGATGAIASGGNPLGAAAGAAVTGLAFAMGEMMEDKAEVVTEPLLEQMKTKIEEEGATIGQALVEATARGAGDRDQPLAARVGEAVSFVGRRPAVPRQGVRGAPGTSFGLGAGPTPQQIREFWPTEQELGFLPFGGERLGRQAPGVAPGEELGVREAIEDVRSEIESNREELRRGIVLDQPGATEDQIESAFQEIFQTRLEQRLQDVPDLDRQQARTVTQVTENILKTQEGFRNFDELLDLAAEDFDAFIKRIQEGIGAQGDVNSALADMRAAFANVSDQFEKTTQIFKDAQGNLPEPLARVQRLQTARGRLNTLSGLELGGAAFSEELINQMRREITQRLKEAVPKARGFTQDLSSEDVMELLGLKETEESVKTFQNVVDLNVGTLQTLFADVNKAIEKGLVDAPLAFGRDLQLMQENLKVLTARIKSAEIARQFENLAKIGLGAESPQAQLFKEARSVIAEQAIRRVGVIASGQLENISPERMADQIFELILAQRKAKNFEPSKEKDELEIPGQTALSDAMFKAEKVMRDKLISHTAFTANQMQQMGQDLEQFNKTLRKAELIREFERVAKTVRPGVDLTNEIQQVLGQMQLGGETLATLLEDPEQLADFLTDIEFGDVTVDKSQQNTFTIRISSPQGEDAFRAAEQAEKLMAEINRRTREVNA